MGWPNGPALAKGTVFPPVSAPRAGIFQALLDDEERAFQETVCCPDHRQLGPGAAPLDRLIRLRPGPAVGFLFAYREIARRRRWTGSQPVPSPDPR